MLDGETFQPGSWLAIYTGLGVWPERHEPLVDIFAHAAAAAGLESVREIVRTAVGRLPAHAAYLKEVTRLA